MSDLSTLITGEEVRRFSPARFDSPTGNFCIDIKNREIKLFRECLGLEFYADMLDDVVEYHNVPVYSDTEVYNTDDLMLFDGMIFVSLVDNNTFSPEDDTKWAIAPKFYTAKYQYIWDNYLRYYLAYMVLYSTINYSTFQPGSMGLVFIKNYTEQGQSTAGMDALWNFKANLKNDAIDILENLKVYIKENINDFPMLKSWCGVGCKTRKSRRIYFRNS